MNPGTLGGHPLVSAPAMEDGELETDLRLAMHLRTLSRVSLATAHDLRTPMHTVVLYIELLRSTLSARQEADTPQKQERYLDVIASEVQRLERMLETLWAETRLTDSKPERLDLRQTLADLVLFLEPHARRLRVDLRLEGEGPLPVEAERGPLRHALLHVLFTAMEALPAASALALAARVSEGEAVVTLRGDGLAGRFAALEAPSGAPDDPGALGTERGLHVSRRVLERNGGTIKVHGGEISRIEVRLPLAALEVE